MKKIYIMFLVALTLSTNLLMAKSIQNVQVFSADNKDGKITTKSIDEAFEKSGLFIDGNNDMNKPFSLRFKKTFYKTYNLAMFRSKELSLKLLKKYPTFGLLTPLTMSIWEDKGMMNISTLTLEGIARAGEIPVDDPDLIAYAKLIKTALKNAMPNGKFKELNHTVEFPNKSFQTSFVADLEIEPDTNMEELKEEFEDEFEGEMEPIGFLMPGYLNLTEEMFVPAGYDAYDFYDTYSICKFDVIYPVSKDTPEAGAYAPCAFYLYKKKGENKMHMGWLGVDNWITTLDIKDKKAVDALREAHKMIEDIIAEIIE
ncbi:MAG: hypothetical protein GXO30_07640 [Epsilonproteobacteria bacterium]|nr:hypothetical protein [Campylobacterota bacterium]